MDIQQLILAMPFRKFAQLGFLQYDRDASRLRFSPGLLLRHSPADRDRLQGLAGEVAERYFSRISIADD